MSYNIRLTNGKLADLKQSLNAKEIFTKYVKITHRFDTFEIREYQEEDGKQVAVILKVYTRRLKPYDLALRQLIAELEILSKHLEQ
ncbi:MAG TPA: hypothetical protein PLT78_14970 [Ignavibacteriaceae bacterium]|nr:hypothetical protein [Ignavibacteriaceae bacterium]